MTMYELSAKQAELTELIVEEAQLNEGVIPEELFNEMMACDADINEKVENCAKAVKIIEGEASVIDGQINALQAEIERLNKRKAHTENAAERLKARVIAFMKEVGKDKVKTALFTIYPITKPSVNILDEDKLPIDCRKTVVKTEHKPDKKFIRTLLECGQAVTGAELVYKTSLQIR